MASKIFTPRIKRVGFADPLTSSPGQSKPKISPSGDVTHKKSNDDIKESAGYKDMPSSVSELLYALHEKTVDDILSDEASQHSSRFDDYSQIPRTSDTPDYGRSPDRSQGTQQRLQAEFQLSSPDWALGKRIIPHILSDFELADDTTSESGSEMSSELEFESATESRSQPKSTTTLESIMLPPDSPQPNALLTDIESIDLSGSPAPQSPPYSTARDYRRSQDSDDETSDFEFDSDCEEDYHRFPLVSRPLVRDLGFALCATDFMQKGVYPVNRAEKRTFVDYASQKASEISMTEEEFARMMNALRGVYLLQWGEKTGKAPKVPPEAGQNAMTGDGKDQLWVNSGEHSAVKSQTQPAALGFESVESLPHADSVDEQDGDVVLESRLNERKFKAMKHSVSKSSGRLNPVSIGEPEKGCMTLPDESKLGSPDWRTTAAAIDVSLPKTPSCGSGSPRMERKPVGQKGKPSGGGVEEKATKAEAALDHAATSGKKRKQDDDIIIIPKRHPENTASVDKSKRRKKAHRSSGNHNSSNRSSTLPVQLNKNAQPDIKYLEKAAKDITTNTTERSNALQSQQRSDIESFGTERLNRLSIEPIRDIRPDTTQQSEKSTNTFTSLHAKNASNSASIERPTAPQPVQISRYSNSRQYSGNRGAGSKNAVESEKMESIQESGKVKKAGQSRKRRTTRGTADVTELTGPGKGDKTNKATSSQPHTLVKLDIATRPGTGKVKTCQSKLVSKDSYQGESKTSGKGTLGFSDTDDSQRGTTSVEVRSLYFSQVEKGASEIDSIRTPINEVPSDLLSSDCSELSDVPSDLPDSCPSTPAHPSPSSSHEPANHGMGPPPERVTNDDNELTATLRPTQSRRPPKISRFFPQPLTDPSSCLPFQPISAQTFGLVQEQLAQDPFRLLIATIFLNRTRGHVALPVLFHVFECYPSIAAFATADPTELTELIRCLGFQHQRAKKCIALAQTWLACPPARGCRYRKLHYPNTNDGRDVRPDECLDDEDERVGWEIAHLPGVGAYSLDSWRIFCRDELRGVCKGKTTVASEDGRERGEGAANDSEEEAEFVPEWKKVLPKDKELRAYLTWMWLKEGYVWDWLTGEKTVAGEKVMRAAQRGGIAREVRDGNWMLETSPMKKAVNGFTMDG